MKTEWFRYKHVPFRKAFRDYPQSMAAAISSILLAPLFAAALWSPRPSTFTGFIAGYYLGWVVWSYSGDKWRKEATENLNFCHGMLTLFEQIFPNEAKKTKEALDEKTHMSH